MQIFLGDVEKTPGQMPSVEAFFSLDFLSLFYPHFLRKYKSQKLSPDKTFSYQEARDMLRSQAIVIQEPACMCCVVNEIGIPIVVQKRDRVIEMIQVVTVIEHRSQ